MAIAMKKFFRREMKELIAYWKTQDLFTKMLMFSAFTFPLIFILILMICGIAWLFTDLGIGFFFIILAICIWFIYLIMAWGYMKGVVLDIEGF